MDEVCHEWNTIAHLADYEGNPERRPFTYDELHADSRVERIAGSGRKGALAALRDAQLFKTAYAFGLRRRELVCLDVADDTGGVVSHASIVARDFGIPAVVGTGNATTVIQTGDQTHVDGDAGRVEIIR